MKKDRDDILRSKNITVAGGVMTIETNIMAFKEHDIDIFAIGTEFPLHQGIETVKLSIDGQLYPLIDNFGDLVVSGRMRDGRYDCRCGNIETANYKLGYGANGMPEGVAHFVVFEGLCPMRYNGPSGALTPIITQG